MIEVTLRDLVSPLCFWLCFSRWLAIIIHLPLFDNSEVPFIVKVLTTLTMTYAFFPLTENIVLKDIMLIGQDHFLLLTIYYTLMGLFLGYMVKMIMNTFVSAGVLITLSTGHASIRYFDPSFDQSVGPFEKLIQSTLLILIISSGALLPMLKGSLASFSSLSLVMVHSMKLGPQFFLHFVRTIFLSALLLASPLVITNLLMSIVLGITARTVPQINIFLVSFIINVIVGLFVFVTTSNEFFYMAFKIYTEILGDWYQFFT